MARLTSTDLPEVADLWGVIETYRGTPHHAKLVSLAERAQRAQSCVSDLALASTTCDALTVAGLNHSRFADLHLTTIQHALIANAVVLYARATSTHSDGGERGSISIDDRLSPADIDDHRILVDLRNRVIAHVHSGEEVGDSVWHTEIMILRDDGDGWLPGCITRRIQFSPETVERLRKMIPLAEGLVRATFYKRIGKLAEKFNEIGLSEEAMERHPFDARKFFGSLEAAHSALAPERGGSALGIV